MLGISFSLSSPRSWRKIKIDTEKDKGIKSLCVAPPGKCTYTLEGRTQHSCAGDPTRRGPPVSPCAAHGSQKSLVIMTSLVTFVFRNGMGSNRWRSEAQDDGRALCKLHTWAQPAMLILQSPFVAASHEAPGSTSWHTQFGNPCTDAIFKGSPMTGITYPFAQSQSISSPKLWEFCTCMSECEHKRLGCSRISNSQRRSCVKRERRVVFSKEPDIFYSVVTHVVTKPLQDFYD